MPHANPTLTAYDQAAALLRGARHAVAFTGAGISVASGIPSFRGEDGLWSRYDPQSLEIDHFRDNPAASWKVLKAIFYDFMSAAQPNAAHEALAVLERQGLLSEVITQNIDHLHQDAGSTRVYELHGNIERLACLRCGERFDRASIDLTELPPLCGACSGLLKPDLVFFGEALPPAAYAQSVAAATAADVLLVIGTTGEVMPAAMIPPLAKEHGAHIIEVNTCASRFTRSVTDIFLEGPAVAAMRGLMAALDLPLPGTAV